MLLQAWLPVGAAAGYCECQADSARIDMRLFAKHMPPALRREVRSRAVQQGWPA